MEVVDINGILYDLDILPNGSKIYTLHTTEEMHQAYLNGLKKESEEVSEGTGEVIVEESKEVVNNE